MLVNGALTVWITFVEKGIVYQGTAPDGSKVNSGHHALSHYLIYAELSGIQPARSKSKANRKTANKISISTSTKKNVPTYNVVVNITPKNGGISSKVEFVRSFTEWFDAQGHFVALPFQTMLATTVPLIAQVDPKRAAVAAATAPGVSSDSTTVSTASSSFLEVDAQTLDTLAAAEAMSSTTTGAESNAGKKSKRRKA